MKIDLPNISEQQQVVFEESTKAAIKTLKKNLEAPRLPPQTFVDESNYPNTHLLRKNEGWEAPHKDIVDAYFKQIQEHFPEYSSDRLLAPLLGVKSARRLREYKQGKYKAPYGLWRKLLKITGRAPQDVYEVLGFMG